jgi:cob(I)alamin adenosyltransferase
MAKFYTQTGDDGYTGLLGEGRAPKYDQRIETLGAIDEANSAIGLARSVSKVPEIQEILLAVQKDLYHLMTEIALLPENSAKFHKFSKDRVSWLEGQIDNLSKTIHIPNEFIVPGDTQPSAFIDLARAIIRRAERNVAHLLHLNLIDNHECLRYLNRLSSLCFALELLENEFSGIDHPTLAKEE